MYNSKKTIFIGMFAFLAVVVLCLVLFKLKIWPNQLNQPVIIKQSNELAFPQYSKLDFFFSFEYPTGWHFVMNSLDEDLLDRQIDTVGYLSSRPIHFRAADGPTAEIMWTLYATEDALKELRLNEKYKEEKIRSDGDIEVYEYSYQGGCGVDVEGVCTLKGYYAILTVNTNITYKEFLVFDARQIDIDFYEDTHKVMKHIAQTLSLSN